MMRCLNLNLKKLEIHYHSQWHFASKFKLVPVLHDFVYCRNTAHSSSLCEAPTVLFLLSCRMIVIGTLPVATM